MHGAAAQQVQMHVEHGLSCVAIRVEHRAKATRRQPAIVCDSGGSPHQFPEDLIVFSADVVERRDVPFRNDEYMRRSLWIDVVEREHAFVFVDDVRGNRALDDFAEQAVGHGR